MVGSAFLHPAGPGPHGLKGPAIMGAFACMGQQNMWQYSSGCQKVCHLLIEPMYDLQGEERGGGRSREGNGQCDKATGPESETQQGQEVITSIPPLPLPPSLSPIVCYAREHTFSPLDQSMPNIWSTRLSIVLWVTPS